MDWIDGNVAVGGRLDAASVRRRRRNGIDIIVDARVLFDRNYGEKRPLADKLLKAADALVALSQQDMKVLIRCNRGRDRSPFLAMVYVAKRYGKSYEEAYRTIKEKRPRTVYHWEWVKALER